MSQLAKLNRQSREKAIKLEDVDWQRPIDASKLWVPWELCPLSYTAIYQELSEAEKLADNHIYALSLAEQFVFLEESILNQTIDHLKAHPSYAREHLKEPEFAEALEHLYQEEEVHAEMFWRLCERADPGRYQQRRFQLIPMTRFRRWLVDRVFSRPALFPFWCWVGALFEEKTIYFSRLYEKYSEEEMDATFARVHRLHMIDEARHFALERIFVERFWRGVKGARKRLNLSIFGSFLKNFVHPIESSLLRFDALLVHHPRLKALRPMAKQELQKLPENEAWLKASFGPDILPGCFKLFDQYPEIKDSIRKLGLLS